MTKRRKKVLNVTDGGRAFPIAPGYFLMKGRTHEQGGIGIGNNLEVEDGEIIKTNKKSLKVLSNAPIMNGISPAQMALGGLNNGTFEKRFNQGFKYQERFKDRNGLNDDGSKTRMSKIKALIGTEEPIYYDDTYIEPAVVKAFNSQEDYNRYYGEQFGKQVAEGMNNAAPYVLEAAMLPFTISGAVETPMLLYQGVKAAPQLVRGAKTLLTKGKKVFGKKVLGMVDDISGYMNADSHFRIVDRPAIDDAIESGLIRAKTGLYHGTSEYLKANFSKYLDDIPGWESMDAIELKKLLESKGAFDSLDDTTRAVAKLRIRNSTNQGGTVHYFKGMTYPNYNVKSSNFVIETPHNPDVFVAGHGGREYGHPLGEWGASLLKTNGSVKGASIPTKGSSYWQYSPFWGLWKNNKFELGGESKMKQIKRNVPSTGKRKKAKLGLTVGDWVNLGGNVLGLIGSTWGASKSLAKQRDYQLPTPYQAAKFKTNININSELNELRRTVDKYNKFVDRNTASSQVAYNRRLGNELSFLENYNQLYGQKEKTETQLINQDRLNQQEVANKYIQDVASIKNLNIDRYNRKLEGYADINTNLLQGITDIGTGLFKNLEDRKRYRTSLKLMPYMYPEINKEEYNKLLSEIVG